MKEITGLIGRENLVEKAAQEVRKGRHVLLAAIQSSESRAETIRYEYGGAQNEDRQGFGIGGWIFVFGSAKIKKGMGVIRTEVHRI